MARNTSTSSDNCHSETDSVPIVDSFKCTQMHCIFCAKESPPAFVIERGKLMRIKEEMELNSFGCENVILARQLRAINIMRNILDIREETCSKLLAQFDGQFNPEFWVKVCVSCKVFVEEINTIRREVARLEKKAKNLKEKLKGFIATSNDDEELDVDSLLWREIREEVLAGFEETPQAPVIIEDEEQQEESHVNVQMEVEVEPEFRVKTELQEDPESCTRVTRQRTVKAMQAAEVRKNKKVGAGKKSKRGKAAQKPIETEGNGESEGNSVELNSEPEVQNNIDKITEQITIPNKPEPIVVKNVTTNAAASGNVNGSAILSLPDEILERIFGNLEEKGLLNCRLVHSTWKAAWGRIMEQKLLSFFTKWITHQSYKDLHLNTLIPALLIKVNPRNLKGITFKEQRALSVQLMNYLVAPNHGTQVRVKNPKLFSPPVFGKVSLNPFPSSSLRFGMRERVTKSLIHGKVEREIYPIFRTYGKLLTILVLDGYRVHAREFAELLSHLPKLKSLSLEAAQFHGGDSFNWNASTLPSLDHLTHLRCVTLGQNSLVCEALNPEPLLWILEKYGIKLIGLTVSGRQYLSLEYVEKLEKIIEFRKLKQLKVNANNTAILKLTQGAALSHIMVQSYSNDKNSLGLMLPLIESFSKTLECLCIPSGIGNLGQHGGKVVAFPKLKELTLRVLNQESEMLGLKNFFKSRFRKLEKLQFIHYCNGPAVEVDMKIREYWKLLPKLKTITYFDDRHDLQVEKSRRSIHARTRVVWSGNRLEELLLPNNIHATNHNCVIDID